MPARGLRQAQAERVREYSSNISGDVASGKPGFGPKSSQSHVEAALGQATEFFQSA